MKVEIEISKEFEEHFNKDRFVDSLVRLCVDIDCSRTVMSGLYELELLEMLRDSFENAKVIKE